MELPGVIGGVGFPGSGELGYPGMARPGYEGGGGIGEIRTRQTWESLVIVQTVTWGLTPLTAG